MKRNRFFTPKSAKTTRIQIQACWNHDMIFFSHIQVIPHCLDLEIPQIRELLSFSHKKSQIHSDIKLIRQYQDLIRVENAQNSLKSSNSSQSKLFSALIRLDSDRLPQKPHFDSQSSNLKALSHKEMKKSKLRIQARDWNGSLHEESLFERASEIKGGVDFVKRNGNPNHVRKSGSRERERAWRRWMGSDSWAWKREEKKKLVLSSLRTVDNRKKKKGKDEFARQSKIPGRFIGIGFTWMSSGFLWNYVWVPRFWNWKGRWNYRNRPRLGGFDFDQIVDVQWVEESEKWRGGETWRRSRLKTN